MSTENKLVIARKERWGMGGTDKTIKRYKFPVLKQINLANETPAQRLQSVITIITLYSDRW